MAACGLATFVTALVLLLVFPTRASGAPGADELYTRAVAAAHAGDNARARALAQEALAVAPDYVDVEVLLGRLAAWDKDFASARKHLDRALSLDSDYVDALAARSDVEFWDGDPQAALSYCDRGLAVAPHDPELLDRRRRFAAALEAKQQPKWRAGKRVDSASSQTGSAVNRMAVSYMNESFDRDFSDWHESIVSLEHEGERGSVIGRVTYFNRFGDDALFFEVDAYPDIREGTYAFLSLGRSTDSIVAEARWAAEIFQALPRNLEASFGYRAQKFDMTIDTLTASIAAYLGRYYVALRPYRSEVSGEHTTTWTLKLRRYFDDEEEYVTVTLTDGSSVEEDPAAIALFELDSYAAVAEFRKRICDDYVATFTAGFENQELPSGADREKLSFGLGFEYLF